MYGIRISAVKIPFHPGNVGYKCDPRRHVAGRAPPHAVAIKAGDRLYGEAVERYLHRHRVKPGITGWAQVSGLRGEVDTLEKAHARVAHDLYYIEHWSPWRDLKILLKTVGNSCLG